MAKPKATKNNIVKSKPELNENDEDDVLSILSKMLASMETEDNSDMDEKRENDKKMKDTTMHRQQQQNIASNPSQYFPLISTEKTDAKTVFPVRQNVKTTKERNNKHISSTTSKSQTQRDEKMKSSMNKVHQRESQVIEMSAHDKKGGISGEKKAIKNKVLFLTSMVTNIQDGDTNNLIALISQLSFYFLA